MEVNACRSGFQCKESVSRAAHGGVHSAHSFIFLSKWAVFPQSGLTTPHLPNPTPVPYLMRNRYFVFCAFLFIFIIFQILTCLPNLKSNIWILIVNTKFIPIKPSWKWLGEQIEKLNPQNPQQTLNVKQLFFTLPTNSPGDWLRHLVLYSVCVHTAEKSCKDLKTDFFKKDNLFFNNLVIKENRKKI